MGRVELDMTFHKTLIATFLRWHPPQHVLLGQNKRIPKVLQVLRARRAGKTSKGARVVTRVVPIALDLAIENWD